MTCCFTVCLLYNVKTLPPWIANGFVAYVVTLYIYHTHLVNLSLGTFLATLLTRQFVFNFGTASYYICDTYLYLFFISALSVFQDFDQDDYLGKDDLKQTLRAITANELTDEEMEFVSDKV